MLSEYADIFLNHIFAYYDLNLVPVDPVQKLVQMRLVKELVPVNQWTSELSILGLSQERVSEPIDERFRAGVPIFNISG